MNKRLLLIGLFLGSAALPIRAQVAQLKGVVVDKDTKEPLPFTSIGLKDEQVGALTNEHGLFIVPAPSKAGQDTLLVMALGYLRRAIAVKRGVALENLVIEVPKRAIALKGVTVQSGKIKNLGLGSTKIPPARA